ncbi:NAD-dependent epimerase/dehydratase family protein [Haloferax mediterranei ATCC 33500]|uniref:NAD-dependent epimerase/dehydratase family protein n=1 Tax=Haloferax mediterranei (strain ATCC 33500 / DSM 1411 / JCM 8866 / NBRC 14739 / NCIMB 2177 / R-4) TaxID=523841 RepID=I3R641_HALMT|nr:cation:proton antiporter [Haloferax mediterranei]AFK19701.1 potassium transport protein kefC [Haloferax mediterranei ATCC 33500]AHZ23090.1 potassium transporter [Haloferax mediterranei ATCC 33500]EMA00023.1 potassium transport protein kefC [Haloferax mediterranei ATCC 33500]MDX5987554.1 cation:proton antiporter [Haloferax mediterranei ATCC 33500]QCQ74050.1 NAD-dependent epimerase/dehydratase family protein [Haloferax mediterranei ATCC 33500]
MAAAGGANLIPLVAAIIGIGVVSQVLSDRFQVPSVVFLIASGILLGPEVLGVISPDSFGNALQAIVGLSVAIIVFEGAFHLRIDKLREAPSATFRLVTLGAVISFIGTSVVVHYALDAPWAVSFLVGALLVATGPTVIAPILEVVPVRDRVGAALDTEGIVNDVTAAIVAVVIFEAILEGVSSPNALVTLFAERLGVGVVVGGIVAAALYYVLRYVDLSPGNAPQNARLLTLAGALVSYAAADFVATEAGIAAVATAGILLGNAEVPYEEEISAFKGDITLLVLSFVFIALAALLEFENLLSLGVGGIAVVVAVALIIRPLLVFISARGDRFTREEKLFMSFVGPRGIIPASVATLFAIAFREKATELAAQGATQQAVMLNQSASILVGTVFLVILTTVVFEAGLARQIAEYLDVIPMRVLIIGGGKVGRALAERLADRGENVVLIEQDLEVVQTARNKGFTVHHGDGTDTDVLRSAGADNAKVVVAATGDDDVNLLVSQLSNSKFDPESVLARANNPDNVEAFEELGVRTISSTMATAQAMDNYIERPTMSNWMGEIGRSGDVQEVEVTAEELIGRTIREVGPELPDGCLITLISRNGDTTVPNAEFTLQEGDRITIIGERDAVRNAETFVHPN